MFCAGVPSTNQSTPYGKLYFKVVNLKHKREKMAVKSKASDKKNNTVTEQSFGALEDLDQGIVQLANYNSLYFFAFSDRHLQRLHCMQVIKARHFVLDWSNLIWLCDHS